MKYSKAKKKHIFNECIKYNMCISLIRDYLEVAGYPFMINKNHMVIKQFMYENYKHLLFADEYFTNHEINLNDDSACLQEYTTFFYSRDPLAKTGDVKKKVLKQLIFSYNNYDCNMKWVTRNREY